jgi:hypothetical protein
MLVSRRLSLADVVDRFQLIEQDVFHHLSTQKRQQHIIIIIIIIIVFQQNIEQGKTIKQTIGLGT